MKRAFIHTNVSILQLLSPNGDECTTIQYTIYNSSTPILARELSDATLEQ